MVRIDSGSAAIDLWSLWGGPLRFEKLELVKPVIILERNAEGTGNWAMGAAASIPSPPVPPVASTYAANRLKIPTLIDLAVSGGNVRFRTSSGQWLRIELDDLKIRADGADRPLSITVEGAYNDQRAKLTAEGKSFDALRDPSHPYGISFSIANPATSIDFKGTLIDPLAFDGVKAALKIQAQRLADLLKIFDAETSADIPLAACRRADAGGRPLEIVGCHGQARRQRLYRDADLGRGGPRPDGRHQPRPCLSPARSGSDIGRHAQARQREIGRLADAAAAAGGEARHEHRLAHCRQAADLRQDAHRRCRLPGPYRRRRNGAGAGEARLRGGDLQRIGLGQERSRRRPCRGPGGALRDRRCPAVAIGRRPGGADRRQARWGPFPRYDRRDAQIRPGGEPRPCRACPDPGANRARRAREDLDRSALLLPQARRNGSGELPAGSRRFQERHRHDLAAQAADAGCDPGRLWPGRFPRPAASI